MPDHESPGAVELHSSTLKWVGSQYVGSFLTFAPQEGTPPATTLAPARRAAEIADSTQAGAQFPVRAAAWVLGHDSVHVRLAYDRSSRAAVKAWTATFAAALADQGLTGVLRRPLPEHDPEAVTVARLYAPAVTISYYGRRDVDRDICARLVDVHGLDRYEKHTLSSGSSYHFQVPWTPDLVDALPALSASAPTHLVGRNGDDGLEAAGLTLFSRRWEAWVRRGTRAEQVDRARAALARLAPDVHHASIEVLSGLHGYHSGPIHPSNGAGKDLYLQRPDLRTRRVVDAHGLQVLTGEHLEEAVDLSGWRTTRIGDRYLVEARDLAPWFAENRPDPAVLEQARSDFGPVIAREDELKSDYAEFRRSRGPRGEWPWPPREE